MTKIRDPRTSGKLSIRYKGLCGSGKFRLDTKIQTYLEEILKKLHGIRSNWILYSVSDGTKAIYYSNFRKSFGGLFP